jgi:hypothetical protein
MKSIGTLMEADIDLWALEAIQTGFAPIKYDFGKSASNEPHFLLPVPSMTGRPPPSDDFVAGGKVSQDVFFKIPS